MLHVNYLANFRSFSALVSLEEYLDSSYSPDREYVDGVVREINVGERPHSKVQFNIIKSLARRYPHLGVWPELRVRTAPTRIRLPDVCITLEDPRTDIFETPPFICIEILSAEDRWTRIQQKIDDYLRFGVPYVFVLDPRDRRAWACTKDGNTEIRDGVLRTENPSLAVPLTEIFGEASR